MEWPPIPLMSGFALQPQSAILRTDMESGHARQRRLTVSAPTDVPVKWSLSREQFAAFEAWFHHTLFDGVAWYEQRLVNGQGQITVEARFKGKAYQAEMQGPDRWLVSAQLEVKTLPLMTPEALEAYLNG